MAKATISRTFRFDPTQLAALGRIADYLAIVEARRPNLTRAVRWAITRGLAEIEAAEAPAGAMTDVQERAARIGLTVTQAVEGEPWLELRTIGRGTLIGRRDSIGGIGELLTNIETVQADALRARRQSRP